MPLFFALTMLISAGLLFLVQPMVGRMALPLLGGSPAVWNTCMVFFQGLLLLGYFYTHGLTGRLPVRRQVAAHLAVLTLPLAAMGVAAALSPDGRPIPVLESLAPQGQAYPMFGVLAMLAVAVGLPFFAVSTSAPLLQKWFADTGHRHGRDPYYLYGASNLGSLAALLAYPLLVEPTLTVRAQTWAWAGGYAVLLLAVLGCGLIVRARAPRDGADAPVPGPASENPVGDPAAEPAPPSAADKSRWVALAFVPSSLMLALTYFITTDIGAVPLLWVIPLALYLLTFIVAFARIPGWAIAALTYTAPAGVLLLLVMMLSEVKPGFAFWLAVHLGAFFLTALLMHGELARSRPPARHLTGFYLWVSVGGVLGGVFNSLVAPVAFNQTLEYPITLALACLLIPRLSDWADDDDPARRRRDYYLPLFVFAVALSLKVFQGEFAGAIESAWPSSKAERAAGAAALGVPALLAYMNLDRPRRFGLCVAGLVAASLLSQATREPELLVRERSYFGTLNVREFEGRRDLPPIHGGAFAEAAQANPLVVTRLTHGTTLHGEQVRDSGKRAVGSCLVPLGAASPLAVAPAVKAGQDYWRYPGREPLTYYHRTGPVGAAFEALKKVKPGGEIGAIGLGTGSLACYADRGQRITFFEIDPTVLELVVPPTYFTYIEAARGQGAEVDFVLGDARLKLAEQPDGRFAVLLVDAFSSDAIPVHLLTTEAVRLYLSKVESGGLVCVHISNRYLNLRPVVARIAREVGAAGAYMNDPGDDSIGKSASEWVVLARRPADLTPLRATDGRWRPLRPDGDAPAWTDDFSDLLSVMNFKDVRNLRSWLGLGGSPSPGE